MKKNAKKWQLIWSRPNGSIVPENKKSHLWRKQLFLIDQAPKGGDPPMALTIIALSIVALLIGLFIVGLSFAAVRSH